MNAKSIYAGDASSIYATNTMFPKDIALQDDLKFDVAAPAGWEYAPGDTIIGHLMRKSPLVTPECTVSVWLAGRVRTKIWRDKDSRYGPDVYGDHWNLFHGAQDVVHDGPLHHLENSDEPLSWPIAVQIPTLPSPSVGKGHIDATSFTSLEKPSPSLPGTFTAHGSDFPNRSEGVVEYAINARLNYIHRGARRVFYTTLLITLRHPLDSGARLGETKECHIYHPLKIQSQRLLPGMEDVELSLGQKTRKLFHSTKVPEFWYEITMGMPTAIQLNSSEPFPLVFTFLPRDDKTSGSIKNHPQKIHIKWVNLRLHCTTAVMAASNLRENYAQTDQQIYEVNLHLQKVFDELGTSLVISSTGKGNEPINLGNMFQLNLRSDGLYTAGKRLVRWPSINSIYPDFTAYGIKHTHSLEPSVSLSIAGEEKTVKFKPQNLQIIGAA
ncbi:hypothetical protein N7509_008606 [Penicillium cosmopolitanum]|uniref:Arrestin-like N-terminal domain-containing protein n=1 Tax=Penicillium cosmopolitanum TaxID=1131564 RepID=A0A9W9VMZ1_9EURO|nr:uncharacterized protein N7509_008606 [Penicillium cosmopolitanum]KAJ5386065.1 hypothetical protein N7509_008606 [Penicillium cosmopolitanum]